MNTAISTDCGSKRSEAVHRLYENEDITVFWDSDRCFHARRCISSAPGVFNFARKPWVDLSKGKNPAIWKTVKLCPSGALDIIYNHGIRVVMEEENLRSAAYEGDRLVGECDYENDGDSCRIYHTGVDPAYTDKGIARRLVFKVAESAERQKKKLVPVCSYAKKALEPKKPDFGSY